MSIEFDIISSMKEQQRDSIEIKELQETLGVSVDKKFIEIFQYLQELKKETEKERPDIESIRNGIDTALKITNESRKQVFWSFYELDQPYYKFTVYVEK